MNRNIGILTFGILYVMLLILLVCNGMIMIAGAAAFSLFALQLLRLNEKLLYWIFFFGASSAVLPVSTFKTVPVAMFLQMLFIGKTILDWILLPNTRLRPIFTDFMLIGMIGLLLLTANVRGAGFYSFGGGATGGAEYMVRIIGVFFLLVAAVFVRNHEFSPKRAMQYFLYGTILNVTINVAARAITPLGGLLSRFFSMELENASWVALDGVGARRLPFLGALPIALLPFVMNRKKFSKRIFGGVICLLLCMMTGFRSGMVGIALMLVVAEIYMYRLTAMKVIIGAVIGFFSMAAAWIFAPYLGFRIQRVLVAIPGFESRVSADASFDVSQSTEWRLNLYEECLFRIPDYLLIGRGFGDSVEDILSMFYSFDAGGRSADLYFMTHAYHLAIFDLLIDFGGMVTLFFLFSIIYAISKARKYEFPVDSFEKYAIAYLIAALVCIVTIWSNFQGRFMYITMAYTIVNSFLFSPRRRDSDGLKTAIPVEAA